MLLLLPRENKLEKLALMARFLPPPPPPPLDPSAAPGTPNAPPPPPPDVVVAVLVSIFSSTETETEIPGTASAAEVVMMVVEGVVGVGGCDDASEPTIDMLVDGTDRDDCDVEEVREYLGLASVALLLMALVAARLLLRMVTADGERGVEFRRNGFCT